MDDEDEFETYFRRASERAPVKQMSQQHSPVSSTTTMKHRRASLQAPDVMCSIQSASTRNSRSTSPSPETPTRHSGRRRSRRDADRQASSSTSTTTVTEHPDQWQSPGSRSRRRQRSQMTSYVSSPTTAVSRLFKPRSLPAAARTAYQGRRATLAGDLLQIPQSFEEIDRRSSSVSPPPSTSRGPSSAVRRTHLWTTTKNESGNSQVGEGHVIRSFVLSAKGVVNVRNAVRASEVFDEVSTGQGEQITTTQRRTSTTVNHSPQRSPAVSAETWQPELKVLVVGDHGVGKTELIRYFTSPNVSESVPSGTTQTSLVASIAYSYTVVPWNR